MRQPLWIINCALLAIFFIGIYTALIVHPEIPHAKSTSAKEGSSQSQSIAPVNLKSIYENDIFKTYISDSLQADFKEEEQVSIPQPPKYQSADSYPSDAPVFLEPLPITITGIMVFDNEEENRAIILDNRNKEEYSYGVGDDIEDAQIIRIMRNKIIIIRSNSQQETLFLRQQDAILELEAIEPNWKQFIINTSKNEYEIKTKEFATEVKSLGALIDLLNIITAYKDGNSTGVKVGSATSHSLADAMGLSEGDIITSINGISVSSTSDRFKAYKDIINPQTKSLDIKLLRNNIEVSLKYILKRKHKEVVPTGVKASSIKQHIEEKKSSFDKITSKMHSQDKKNIAKFKNKISQSVPGQ